MTRHSWKLACGAAVLLGLVVTFRPSKAPDQASSEQDQQTAQLQVQASPLPKSESSASNPAGVAERPALKPSRGATWKKVPTEPAFAKFHDWTTRYAKASRDEKPALEQEGQALANVRLTAMADLIQTNPERALELAVPYGVRQQLPVSVRGLLEQLINEVGDYDVIGFAPIPGKEQDTQSMLRLATVRGSTYQVFTFGRGLEYVTRKGAPLNGLTVPASAATAPPQTAFGMADGMMVLAPNPVQTLDEDQTAAIKSTLETEAVCNVSKQPSETYNEETALQVAGEVYFFCGVGHAETWSEQKNAAYGLDKPVAKSLTGDVEYSSYTEGRKRMLMCRVDFPDYPGEVMSTNQALTSFQSFSNNMAELSYNKLLMAPLGQGSYITPTMRITNNTSSVESLGSLLGACRNACAERGIDWNQFDFHYVCTAGKPNASFAGVGYVGGDGFWLANSYWNAGVATHEYGHNLGLNHANFWDTSGNSTIGNGTSVEYGDPFDPMGSASASPNHYNSRYKNYLNWISSADCPALTASGTYRVYAHDSAGSATAGVRGLRIVRSGSQNYWIDLRQRFNTKAMLNGVGLHWTGNGNQSSLLLDTTPDSASGKNDATLVIGRTFSDTGLGVHITPIGKGNTYPQSIDVVVNFGSFPANQPPTALVSASSVAASANQTITFSALASDPNGDSLAYSWDFGDADFSTDNQAVTTHSFPSTGEYLVQCTVTDMKGGTARDSVIVRVGNPTTYKISGRVLLSNQQPLQGVRVSVDSSRYAFTDSDGTYTITKIGSSSYTVKAVLDGYSFSTPFFSNPVAGGADFTTADFIAIPGSFEIYTPIVAKGSTWKYLDNGSDQGTAWKASVFNDLTWPSGPGVLGFGQGNEATTLSYGSDANNKYMTYYFRQSFVVNNPSAFTNMLLEVLRDDGVIVYLNGTEIFRDNLPNGSVVYTTPATASVEPGAYLQTNLPVNLLLTGNNVLAAEVHQVDPTSSDLNFDLALSGLSVSNASFLQMAYIASPQSDQTFASTANVTINATVRSSGSAITLVEFFGDNVKLGEDSNAPYSFVWSNPAEGDHSLKIIASLANGMQVTSAPVRISVAAPMPAPTSLTLFPAGSTWRYFASSSSPAGTWTTIPFNDSTWPTGPAQLGYGESDEATVVPYGGNAANKWITAYFRRTFNLTDPRAVTNLTLNLKRDDGAVVYLNGIEVLRDSMPAGIVTWSTLATSPADDGQTFITFNISPASLTQGTNVLAVEIHQSAADSSDMSFDASLVATAIPGRTRGIALLSPTNATTLALPGDLTLTADAVAGGSLAISKVEFFADGTKVAEDNSYPFTALWSNPAAGSRQLVAIGTDSAGVTITSAPVTITVLGPPVGNQLISFGEAWKYLDNGSNQGSNWSRRIFDDRSWVSGPARFGYGGNGELTTLNYGTNLNVRNITAYFRKAFFVPNPNIYQSLMLRLIRDDGAVVYLNGIEVTRDNLQDGQVAWNTLASSTLNAPDETTPVDFEISNLLLVGTNVIAVELHQAAVNSSDATFDLALLGLTSTNITDGIYITSPGGNARFNTPASVELTAFAQSTGGSVTLVEYFDGPTKLGQATAAPYRFTWNNGAIGTHSVTARATYGAGLYMTSAPVSITIGTPPPPIAPVYQTLVQSGSAWKYWDNAVAVGAGWETTSFNDSAWPSGFARFGWGLDGESTTVTSGRVTHYFRHWFNVANPGQLTELVFQLARDDGAVVYLNGVEVFRSNMPSGTITPSTLAAAGVNTPDETTYYETVLPTAGLGLLQGSNVVAVEMHQSSTTSSDAGFDLQLVGTGTTEGRVYLANPTPGALYPSPGNVPLDANAWAGSGSTLSKVEFYAGSEKLGEALTPPYSFVWQNPAFGNYQLTAQAITTSGGSITSAPINITVSYELYSGQLIASNSIWKFLDDGSNQGTNWSQRSYNDAGWRGGPARLGYGNDGEITTVSYGPSSSSKYMTTYFRQWFNAPTNTVVTNLLFRLIRDDGAVVYLNGRELFRSNMPSGTVGYQTAASAAVGGADEDTWYETSITITNLAAGTNLLAVEIHQATADSSDLGMALELYATGYVLPPTPPPTLLVTHAGGHIYLHWPANATGYNLYGAPALGSPWSFVFAPSGTTNGQKTVTISPANAMQFYRLQKP